MDVIERDTIGQGWQDAFERIMQKGQNIKDDDQELKELRHLFLIIKNPDENDPLALNQDESMRLWMNNNFTLIKKIPELKNSMSYAWRLYQFQNVDQIAWIIQTLKKKPESKSATITMLQPAGIEAYVPCISLLDFKLRDAQLELTVTCRSLDFGKKAIHNMCNLTSIGKKVAKEIGIMKIQLSLHVISAHIYKKEWK